MSSLPTGYPDDQERALSFGEVFASAAALAVPASPAVASIGSFAVVAYQTLVLQAVVITNPVTVVATWTLEGAVGGAATSTATVTLPVGTSRFSLTNQGHTLASLTFSGVGGAATVAYALVGANPAPFPHSPLPTAGINLLAAAPQAIANAVLTAVTWPTLNWDTTGLMYRAAQPSRLTPSADGIWLASAYVFWAASAVGLREMRIVNGVTGDAIYDGKMAITTAGVATAHNIAGVFSLLASAGHYLEVFVIQNSGAPLVVNAFNIGYTLTYLGPLA